MPARIDPQIREIILNLHRNNNSCANIVERLNNIEIVLSIKVVIRIIERWNNRPTCRTEEKRVGRTPKISQVVQRQLEEFIDLHMHSNNETTAYRLSVC